LKDVYPKRGLTLCQDGQGNLLGDSEQEHKRNVLLCQGEDIEIKYTGVRPGEKLCEELFNDKENFMKTTHQRIFIAPDTMSPQDEIKKEMEYLSRIVGEDLSLLLNPKKISGGVRIVKG